MADDPQQLTFKVVVDAETGQLKGVAQGFEGLKPAAEQAGEHASNAVDKIEHHVGKMALSIALGGLALEGFKKLAEESGPFQELQGTFESVTETLLNAMGPALGTISTGLQSLLLLVGGILGFLKPVLGTVMDALKAFFDYVTTEVGALINLVQGDFRGAWETMKQGGKDMVAEFKGNGQEYADAWHGLVKAAGDAVDRTKGINTQMTKIQAAHLEALLNAEIAHVDAVNKIREGHIHVQMNDLTRTFAQKMALTKSVAKIELDQLNKEEDDKLKILQAKHDSHQMTEKQFGDAEIALKQQYADKRLAVEGKEADEEKSLNQQQQKAMAQIYEADLQAFASTAAAKYNESRNAGEALKAAGEATIKTITDQAVKEITVYGAKTAAAAYSDVYNKTGGGYYGIAAGAAAAAGVLAEYGALAAVVGGVGYSLAGSVGGGGGGSGGGSGSGNPSSGGATAAATAISNGTSSATPTPTAAPTISQGNNQPAGAAPGAGQTFIFVLDGQVLAKWVNDGTRDGQIQIHAKAIIP